MGAATARAGQLIVNGVAQPITFDPTGGWSRWATISLTVNLNAGSVNTIRLESTGQDLANIDELQVTAPGPRLNSSTYVYQKSPNQLVFTVDRDVSGLGVGNVSIQPGSGAAMVAAAYAYDPATYTATYTLPGVLADGNYRATLIGTGLAGSTAVNVSFTFFALAGDANHDGIVDSTDLGIVSMNWNTTGKTYSQGDFNYDGRVDVADMKIFSANWQQRASDFPSLAVLSPPLVTSAPKTPSSSASRSRS
jgi:hypothetical protein